MAESDFEGLTVALRKAIEESNKEDFGANWKEIKDELTPAQIEELLAIAKTKGNDMRGRRRGRMIGRNPDARSIQRQLEAALRLDKSRKLSSFARGLKVLEEAGSVDITAEDLLVAIAESVRSPPKTQSKKHSKKKKKQTKKKPPKKKRRRRRTGKRKSV